MTQQQLSNNDFSTEYPSIQDVLRRHHWLVIPIGMVTAVPFGMAVNTFEYGPPLGGYLEALTTTVLPNLEIVMLPSFSIGMVLALILWGILKARKPDAWKWHNWLNMGLYISLAIMVIRPVFFS